MTILPGPRGFNRRHFLSLAAGTGAAFAVRDLQAAVKGDPRKTMTLPDDAKIVFTFTIAFESFTRAGNYAVRGGKQTLATLSYAQYAYDVGFWRILELLDRNGLKGSFSTSGLAAKEHPNCIRAMIENGHECYGHGWTDVLPNEQIDIERTEIRDTLKVITDGGGVRPVGWAGPGSSSTVNTLGLLADEGILWNGDDASNDIPFIKTVKGKPMVILPRVNFPTNDLIVIHQPNNPLGVFFDNFKETFDTLYQEGVNGRPQWIDLLLHSDIGSRPPLTGPAQRAISYAKGFSGVWQTRRRDLAEWTLKTQKA